ncbi:hypothetical protein EMIT0P43_40497 [Pseudomonas jessenii]
MHKLCQSGIPMLALDGSCAQGAFGRAGLLDPRSTNLPTAASPFAQSQEGWHSTIGSSLCSKSHPTRRTPIRFPRTNPIQKSSTKPPNAPSPFTSPRSPISKPRRVLPAHCSP